MSAAKPLSLGLTRTARHEYRWNDGPLVPGVTSICAMKDKSGPLVGWAKRETAACAVRNLPMLATMVESGGPKAAIDWLKAIPDYQRETAADLGSRIHVLAEAIAKGEAVELTGEEQPFIAAYQRDFLTRKPRFLAVEAMVYSDHHRYGGTADAWVRLGTETWLIDYKTGSSIYGDTALQLAGLAFADWIGRPGDPKRYRIPRTTRFGVLHIRPEGARLVPYAINEDTFAAFLACRALYEWEKGQAQTVKGEVAA